MNILKASLLFRGRLRWIWVPRWNLRRSLTLMAALSSVFAAVLLPAMQALGQSVAFDVPAIVIAEPVNPKVVSDPITGGQLMRLRISLSTVIAPDFHGSISEYLVEISSPGQRLRVIDFWPKNEAYSEYDGTVTVESSRHKDERFQFGLGAAYPGVGSAHASGDYRNRLNVNESYQRRPPMQAVTSSGTIRQGFGVFYKFRPGPVDVLEGSRQVAILVEVPQGWRADLLRVSMTAAGSKNSLSAETTGHRGAILSTQQFWITTHREGDTAAAAVALSYVRHERHLRGLAVSLQQEVQKRSSPSLWHRVGVALDVVDNKIPPDYLSRVLFGPADPAFSHGKHHLPIDLRVAILDYWDHRDALVRLATSPPSATDTQSISTAMVSTN
jgi:hypothetical protein